MQSVINLSILIPTYKRLDLLQECLHSITQQNVLPKEVLIGNDDNNNFISEEK
ncbi:glycosyl transferase family 2 [Ferrovum sp. JA12]|uniref:glycosyltransferase family 2 protein n=1 Tax=Ferrovum sp. JA12 TaxID=1356299 RepID=UPI0007149073|nr:glycosyl transferase family 2 [Ferrovum sp. JA12]